MVNSEFWLVNGSIQHVHGLAWSRLVSLDWTQARATKHRKAACMTYTKPSKANSQWAFAPTKVLQNVLSLCWRNMLFVAAALVLGENEPTTCLMLETPINR